MFGHNCYSHDLLLPTDILILPGSDVADGVTVGVSCGNGKDSRNVGLKYLCDTVTGNTISSHPTGGNTTSMCNSVTASRDGTPNTHRTKSWTLWRTRTTTLTCANKILEKSDGIEQRGILTQLIYTQILILTPMSLQMIRGKFRRKRKPFTMREFCISPVQPVPWWKYSQDKHFQPKIILFGRIGWGRRGVLSFLGIF